MMIPSTLMFCIGVLFESELETGCYYVCVGVGVGKGWCGEGEDGEGWE